MASRSSRRVVTDEVEDQDLSKVEFETSEDVKVIPTFDAMNLRDDLIRGIYAYGKFSFLKFSSSKHVKLNFRATFLCCSLEVSSLIDCYSNLFVGFEKPSAIQQRAIRPITKGRDVIAQ